MYAYVSLIGLGEIGMIVISLALVTKIKESNGSVAGIYSFFGALGIMVNTQLGGYLFDTWTSTAPFFVMVIGHAIFSVYCIGVMIRDALIARNELIEEKRLVTASSLWYKMKD
jgi:MFS family permease